MDVGLIDRIYECGFVPELWPEVLRETSKLSGSAGASVFVTNPDVSAWTSSRNAHDITSRFIKDGWYWRGQLMKRVHASDHPGFLRDVDICTPEELREEPIYRDSWSRMGLGWGAATAFSLPTGDALSIVLSRVTQDGPASPETIRMLDMLRPHLARTAVMSARLQLERAKAAGDALAALGLAALVFGENGKVLVANTLMETLPEVIRWRAADRVMLLDRNADTLLHDALSRIGLPDNSGVRSFPVREGATGALRVGHLLPIRFSARDIFVRSAAVFVLMPVSAPAAPPLELLRSLFDLTAAEARVARGLATGKVVEEIAGDSGVSPSTVRSQVRAVLQKTGCERQTDVVALMGGLSVTREATTPE
jgi:DNA-binding CsgD family transcriptional regulator